MDSIHPLTTLQQGNGTSVLHRFPYAGINFFCYEHFKEYLGDGPCDLPMPAS
jgi:hypothetical protein